MKTILLCTLLVISSMITAQATHKSFSSSEKQTKKLALSLEAIKGNWFTDDERNAWEYGVYDSVVIAHNRIYRNDGFQKKGKNIEVTFSDRQTGIKGTLSFAPVKGGKYTITMNNVNRKQYTRMQREKKAVSAEEDFKQFFRTDTACLQGYIDKYHESLGFDTGLLSLWNEMTRESHPTVVVIRPDGSFEVKFKIDYPTENYLALTNNYIPFYIEPGQTLTMYIDWESIQAHNRMHGLNSPIKNISYMGPSATISRLLSNLNPMIEYTGQDIIKAQKEYTPDQFKQKAQSTFAQWDQIADSLIDYYHPSKKSVHLIRNKVDLKKGVFFFDFITGRNFESQKDPANQILKIKEDDSYYDFLKKIPNNDETILANDKISLFMNWFEFSRPFNTSYSYPCYQPDSLLYYYPPKSLLTFMKENNVKLNPQQEKLRQDQEKLSEHCIKRSAKEINAEYAIYRELYKKENSLVEKYNNMYFNETKHQMELPPEEKDKQLLAEKTAQLTHITTTISKLCEQPNSFIGQLTLVRRLYYILKSFQSREVAQVYLDNIKKELTHPVLIAEAEHMLDVIHPKNKVNTYQLPEGKAAEIFRNITKKHSGKVLFIDFWATTCGSCRMGIEHVADLQEKYRNHPEFQFIYITSQRESPEKDYNEYVEKHLKNEVCYRISETEYNYLRELFQFNGIPHYELVEKDGSISKEGVNCFNLKPYLEKRFGH